MSTVAAKVAARKERRPEEYCPQERCLWRTGGPRCPRHPQPTLTPRNVTAGAQARAHVTHAASLVSVAECLTLTPELSDEIQRSLHAALEMIADSDRELAALEIAVREGNER